MDQPESYFNDEQVKSNEKIAHPQQFSRPLHSGGCRACQAALFVD